MQKFNSNRNSSGNRSNSGRNDSSRGRNDSRGRNNFSGNRGNFNRGPQRPREEHDAVCDKCGANCTLPFKPTPGKPVLCRDCFQKDKPASSRPRNNFSNRGNFNRGPQRPREEHDAVCDKCHKKCTVPFKPTPGKPVLCKECFQKK
jgi:CxxC-x17-CxxC domain-containing protein